MKRRKREIADKSESVSLRSDRRIFLKTTALSGVGFWIATRAKAQECKSANDKIAFACIGIGGKGSSDSKDAGEAGDVVAICDVDETRLNVAGEKRFPKAKRYTDFRKLYDEMGKRIDAVTVSTPDHNHAAIALMAMRMGKHCFCQKPLTHSIYEARLMAKVAREMNVATQMGNQGTSFDMLRKCVALIQAGTLGRVRDVHVWTNRPIWAQGGKRPKPSKCPSTLDWNCWIGPAAMRPYAKGYHPFAWRGWWDFGTGALGDMACHTMNMPYWALDLRNPVSIQAETSGHNRDSYPSWSKIVYDFPATDKRPEVKLYWYDGGKKPDEELFDTLVDLFQNKKGGKKISKKDRLFQSGCIVVGEKDTLFIPGDYAEKTVKLLNAKTLPDVSFEKSPGHFDEWIIAINGGKPAKSNFVDYAGALTENVLTGNLAVWVANKGQGEKVLWDAQNARCTNIPDLEPLITPTYRKGYVLDVVSCPILVPGRRARRRDLLRRRG